MIKTVEILEAIERLGGEATTTGLARELGCGVSTTSNLVRTLAARGYLEQQSGEKAYRLGRRLLSLVEGTLLEEALAERLRRGAQMLSREVDEDVIVSRLAHGELRRFVRVERGRALAANVDAAGRDESSGALEDPS